jgi:serine/threonine protein kinase/Tfp pilus assembly protein PilF
LNKIENFKLLKRIGKGGMAEVYLAKADYNGLKKIVALKKILQPLSSNDHFRETFRHEAGLSMELNHPNAVQVFEYGQTADGKHLYMIMEFINGVDLMNLMKTMKKENQTIEPGIAIFIISEVLKGLDYAHRLIGSDGQPLELVHRDVSPQNILLSFEGAVKVTDFGIAKALNKKEEEEGVLRGKIHYMSPEQAYAKPLDKRSDIFSTGLILYEMLTGSNPYKQFKGTQALEKAKKAEIKPPSMLIDIPIQLEKILQKTLSPQKENRYQNAREMQNDLSLYLHKLPVLYDSNKLISILDQTFSDKSKIKLAGLETPTINKKSDSNTDFGFTSETHTGNFSIREKKNLVSMIIQVGGMKKALQRHNRDKVEGELENFMNMVEYILIKDKEQRYRSRRLTDNKLLVVRGIPYTGEYDETELLMDAHKIKRDFKVYQEEVPEFNIGIGVDRIKVSIVFNKSSINWDILDNSERKLSLLSRSNPNEIMVSAQIHSAARYNWKFEKIKNDFGLYNYKIINLKSDHEIKKTRMAKNTVGRSFALGRMQREFQESVKKSRFVIMPIIGDMGVGKTTLIQNFIQGIKNKNRVFSTEAKPFNSFSPFSLIISLLKDISRTRGGTGEDFANIIQKELKNLLSEKTLTEIIKTLEILLDSEKEISREHNVGALVATALRRILKGFSNQGPVIAIFEDLQWADKKSQSVLNSLFENEKLKGRVFIILSVRDADDYSNTFHNKNSVKLPIKLTNFDDELTRKFVESRFENPQKAAPLIDRIVKMSEGNPFFINELLSFVVSKGFCETTGDNSEKLVLTRSISANFSLETSPTIDGIISSKLDNLSPENRRIIRLASIAGRTFYKKQLQQMVTQDVDQFLEEFEKRNFIRQMKESGRYTFVQKIMRDFAYSGLAEDDKHQGHLLMAEYLEQNEQKNYNAPVIAMHYEKGGNHEKAVEYYLQAAHHSKNLASNNEALNHYQKILELVGKNKEVKFHAHKDMVNIYRNLGLRNKQLVEIKNMETLALEENKTKWLSEAQCRKLAYFQDIGEPRKTIELFDEVITNASNAQDEKTQIYAYYILARALVDLGEIDQSFEAVSKGMEIINKNPDIKYLKGNLLHIKANTYHYSGEDEKAIAAYEKALKIFRENNKRTEEATILMNLGFLSYIRGNYEKALSLYKKAYQIDISKGDRLYTGVKLSNIAQTQIALGNYSQARKVLQQAKRLCLATKDSGALSDTYFTIALLKLRTGNPAASMQFITEGLRIAREANSKIDEVRGLQLWAQCQLEDMEGDYSEAFLKSEQLIKLAKNSKLPNSYIQGLRLKALTLLKMSKNKEALPFSAKAVSLTVVSNVENKEVIYHTHAKIMLSLKKEYWAQRFLKKAVDIVKVKSNLLSSEQAKQIYLSVYPARNILEDFENFQNN